MVNDYKETTLNIGAKDFVPNREGFFPVVAIYMNEETDIICVYSENIKKTIPKKEADKLIKDIFKNLAEDY